MIIDNPIITEIRTIRQEISADHEHDLQKLLAHYQKLEEEAVKTGKYHFFEQPNSESGFTGLKNLQN